jgi:uncharacterized protein DUF1707
MNEKPANEIAAETAAETVRGIRASDAERERVATMVSDAAGEGRLTLEEAEQRLELIYATKFRHELDQFYADLPDGERSSARPGEWRGRPAVRDAARRVPARLRGHAAVAVVLSVLLIVRWAGMDVPYFWPAGPMFLLFASVLLHARLTLGRGPLPGRRRWGGT